MSTDLPFEGCRFQRSAPLLMLISLFLVPFTAHAQERDTEGPPFTAPAPPTSAPEAPTATAEIEPQMSALPSAPVPVPSQRRWPFALLWTAAGALSVGAGILVGGYLVADGEASRGAGVVPNAHTRGCRGNAACDTFGDAAASWGTARVIGEVGMKLSASAATVLLTVSFIGVQTDPARNAPAKQQAAGNEKRVRIEAAPTVGGFVIRGTF